MRDLNDKITGQELSADEWNDVPSELQSVIESTGQTLTDTDLTQLVKALAVYAGAGSFFVDSGSANSYILAAVDARVAPHEYTDGQRIEFVAANSNAAGTSTVNLASLGSKPIKTRAGENPAAGAISGRTRARYDAANGWFELTPNISAVYASRDTMYTDSGTANNLILTAVGEAPSAYFDGMRFRARPKFNNTGTTTVNVAGLGSKTVTNAPGGLLKAGVMTEFEYIASTNRVRVVNTEPHFSGNNGLIVNDGKIEQYITFTSANDGDISVTFPVTFPVRVLAVSYGGTIDSTDPEGVLDGAKNITQSGCLMNRGDGAEGSYTARIVATGY